MGFALTIISAQEARDALEVFEDERTAAAALMGSEEDR
jgi:hydrogenase maturation factor